MRTLVVRLRAAREAARLSQDALADRAQCTQSTVSGLELGKGRRVDLDILDRIAHALALSPLDLLAVEDGAPKRGKRR